ncbi:Uncharacterized protein Adt_09027 [Abeliophyllum distichum]|uniref:Uncharacterized protein n=1 Tax=Abeliophyllum distichum TaxID=126358 RepID=A0ABD1UGV6_9LAMI
MTRARNNSITTTKPSLKAWWFRFLDSKLHILKWLTCSQNFEGKSSSTYIQQVIEDYDNRNIVLSYLSLDSKSSCYNITTINSRTRKSNLFRHFYRTGDAEERVYRLEKN